MKYETKIRLDFSNTMSIIIDEIEPNSNVLEFGPASGRLTKFLKETMDCKMYIVELDPEAGKIASEYAEDTIIGDIEKYEWVEKFKNIKFDYILFADVLEHLYDPKKVLDACKNILSDTGFIIMSIPHIAHNSVLIDLFKNKFEYQRTGLLDDTHIRFFTYDNIENMVSDLEMYVEKKQATYTQVGFNEFKNTYNDLNDIINPFSMKTRDMGEVYQFIYKITKNPNAANLDCINRKSDYYYFQCFFDKGDGFSDKDEIKETLYFDKMSFAYSFKLSDDIKKLRIDPINERCIVKVTKISALKDDEKMDILFESHNANKCIGNTYAFFDRDPQMVIENNGYDSVEIEFEYIEVDKIELSTFLNQLIEESEQKRCIIEQKENYINELRNSNTVIIDEKNEQIAQQQSQLNELYDFISHTPIRQLYSKYKKMKDRKKEK